MAYNKDDFAVLKYDYASKDKDIGQWELYYKEEFTNGIGLKELSEKCNQIFPQNLTTVVFVKNVKIIHLLNNNSNVFTWDTKKTKMFATSFTKFDFFKLVTENNQIEFREWNRYFEKETECFEFYKHMFLLMAYLKKHDIQYIGVYGLSHDAYKYGFCYRWNDFIGKHTSEFKKKYMYKCIPQNEEILKFYETYDRGGLTLYNPFVKDRIMKNVSSYDKKSCHLATMVLEKFPMEDFKSVPPEYFNQAIKMSDKISWIAEVGFKNLRKKHDSILPEMMYRLGGYGDENNNWRFEINDVDWIWFSQDYEWDDRVIFKLWYANKSLISKKLAVPLLKLFEEKDIQVKGSIARDIAKALTEQPYGKSIQKLEYPYEAVFNEEGEVDIAERDPLSFEEKQEELMTRRLPPQLGIWTVSYSRLDIWKAAQLIGVDKTFYADTDSVKGIISQEIIDVLNKEIDDKRRIAEKAYHITIPKELGKWVFEYKADKFKVVGLKWYAYETNGELHYKAAGAQTNILDEWFKTHDINDFNSKIEVDGLFKFVKYDYKHGYVKIESNRYICELLDFEQQFYSGVI